MSAFLKKVFGKKYSLFGKKTTNATSLPFLVFNALFLLENNRIIDEK